MKKLFTLIAAALMTIGASAKTPLTATWNSWGDGCTVDGNTITFTAAWKGAGYWVSADASTSDKLVIVLAEEAVGKTKIFFQCQPETGTDLVSSGDYFITGGSKILGIDLQSDAAKDRLSAFQQICAQSTEANCKIVVKEIYLGTNEEYENDLAGNKQQKSPLSLDNLGSGWGESTYDASTKTVTIGEDWSGKGWWLGTVDYSDFDQLVIKFDPATATNGNIVIEYNAGESTKYEFAAGTTTAIIDLDATGKASVKQIYIQGPAAATYTLADAYVATKEYVAENETTGGDTPAAPVTISWSETAAKGSLNGTSFGDDFKLTVTDVNSKIEIDANNAYFGDAENQIKFTHRLKTGGKSDSKNNLTLTIPSDGTLKVYVRTGSNSATDRNLVLTQGESELYNKVVKEADAVKVAGLDEKDPSKETSVYPIIEVAVKAGTVAVTYPTNSLNFYGFEFVSGSTGIQQTIAPAKVIENNVIYNLAGQKVNESYKGIVIKNGKKYFQK